MKCDLNNDEKVECSCAYRGKGRVRMCDVYDEPICKLEVCPLDERILCGK